MTKNTAATDLLGIIHWVREIVYWGLTQIWFKSEEYNVQQYTRTLTSVYVSLNSVLGREKIHIIDAEKIKKNHVKYILCPKVVPFVR